MPQHTNDLGLPGASTRGRRGRSLLLPAGGLLAACALLVGCSGEVSVGGGSIDRAQMEADIATQLAAEVPDAPTPTISCPDAIDATVGATGQCELSVDGDEAVFPVAVEVTSVEGSEATFDIEVGAAQ